MHRRATAVGFERETIKLPTLVHIVRDTQILADIDRVVAGSAEGLQWICLAGDPMRLRLQLRHDQRRGPRQDTQRHRGPTLRD
jgi:hypothetical protein